MSLINDALKRASQSQRPPPPAGPLGIPLQPAESSRPAPNSWLVPVLGIALVVMSGLFLWVWWRSQKNTQQVASAPAVTAVTAPPAPKTVPAPAPNPSVTTVAKSMPAPPKAEPEKPKAPLPSPIVEPKVVVTSAPVPEPVPESPKPAPPVESVVVPPAPVTPPPVAAPKVEFPPLKLQGIFYRLSKPSALISGKSVFVGDKVEGARVVTIERMSVTLEFSGERKVLNLE